MHTTVLDLLSAAGAASTLCWIKAISFSRRLITSALSSSPSLSSVRIRAGVTSTSSSSGSNTTVESSEKMRRPSVDAAAHARPASTSKVKSSSSCTAYHTSHTVLKRALYFSNPSLDHPPIYFTYRQTSTTKVFVTPWRRARDIFKKRNKSNFSKRTSWRELHSFCPNFWLRPPAAHITCTICQRGEKESREKIVDV